MTRKILVIIIALIYMILGLLNFFNALIPTLTSTGLIILRIFPLIASALAFFAGLSMFRLNEMGRKVVVVLLSIRIVLNAYFLFRLPESDAGFGIQNRLGELIYRVEFPYAYQGFLLIWIAISLLIIIFLLQRETKKIFIPATIKDAEPDVIFE